MISLDKGNGPFEGGIADLTVDFSFGPNNVCSGQSVSFTSIVTGDGPFDYEWAFGDGSFSTDENPNHIFQAFGCGTQNFNVTLTVTDNNGEVSSDSQTISILEEPEIGFVHLNPFNPNPDLQFSNCGNTNVSTDFFVEVGNNSISASCISSYNINWGDGSTESNVTFPISHNYVGFGTYNLDITAIGDNGCSNTVRYIVRNATNPSGGISGPGNTLNLCAPTNPIQFEITGWGTNTSDTSYEVDFGDGTTVNYTQADLLAFDPTGINPFPVAPHSYTESSCPDEFVVRLWIRNACAPNPNPATLPNILIIISPQADFEAPEIECVNSSVQFINTSETGSGLNCSASVNFVWDFGDGSSNVVTTGYESVNHVFTNPGTYTVTLTGDNFSCDESMYSQDICIEPPLNPTFTSNNNEGCAPFNIALTNTTDLTDQCDVPTYEWTIDYTASFCGTSSDFNFINGTNSNSENPQIEFINPGTYEIVLEATNSCGTASSVPQEIFVKAPPQVAINDIEDFCETSSTISPSATVDDCGPNPPTYNWIINTGTSPIDWEFVNGTNANSELPDIEFYTSNTYVLSLEVTNACGSNIDTEEFVFSPVPEITNTDLTQTICSGTSIEEIVLQSDNPNTTYELIGTSPTGNVTGILPSGTVTTISTHILTLNSGTTGTVVYTITPFLVDGCPGEPVEFIITVNEGPSITSHPVGGTYCIGGASDMLAFTLLGNPTGTIAYQWYVNDTGSNDPLDGDTTEVSSPEGQEVNYQPPTDTVGTLYYFCVISFSGSGSCSEITTIPAEVTVNPNIEITNETPLNQLICAGANTEILSFSINGGGAGTTSYIWYLSDDNIIDVSDTQVGTNSDTYDPGILSIPGEYYYYVTIDVDESLGCLDVSSEIFIIEVVEDPEVTITPTDQTICTNVSADVLVAQVTGGIDINNDSIVDNLDYEFQWFLNGVAITGANEATYNHDSTLPAGVYDYYCEISQSNSLDCNGTSNTVIITVNEGPSITSQPVGGTYCIGGASDMLAFTLLGNPTGTIAYQWYVNDTGSNDPLDGDTTEVSSPEGQEVNYQPPTDTVGTLYYFCVISFSGSGSCSEITTIPAEVTVNPNIEITNETPLNQLICAGANTEILSFSINGGGAGTTSYIWYLSDDNIIDVSDTQVGTNSDTYDPGILSIPGEYYYYVTIDVDESLGCLDVSSEIFIIEVVEDPEVTITPTDQTICTNVSADVLVAQVTGGIDINNDSIVDNLDYEFQWFLNGVAITGANEATYNHDSTLPAGVYDYYCEISQSNSLDCNGTSNTVIITVNEGPSITSQPVGGEYCLGDTIDVIEVDIANGVGMPDFQWYSNDTNDIDTPTLIGTNSNVLQITNTNVGELFYYCVVSFSTGGCSNLTSEIVSIKINQVPEIGNLQDLICSNNIFSVTPGNSSGNIVPFNTVYTWPLPIVNPPGSIIGASEQSMPTDNISQMLENITLTPATVTYLISPASGDCDGNIFEVIVTVNPSISVISNVINNSCFESNNASVELSIEGGVPFTTPEPYNISWEGPNGFLSSDEAIFNLEAGTYTVNIEDNGGCPYSESFTITEPELLTFGIIDFNPETISCFGANDGLINISVEGGTLDYFYNWTKNGITFSNDEDLSNLGPGLYEIAVTDASNCGPITKSFLIEEPLPLEINISTKTDILCFGDATGIIDIEVFGGRPDYLYTWTGPDGFISNNQNIDTLFAGRYIVEVSDTSGCTKILEIELLENSEINIETTATDIECYGDNNASITINNITGGVAPYTISWSNFGSGNIQENLSAGTYTITIEDFENCIRNFDIVIDEAPLFLIDPVLEQMSCANADDGSITLNFVGGIDPITIVWDDEPTAGVERNNLGPGEYSVTITDGKPCVIQENFIINDIAPLAISANTIDALDCDDINSGSINLQIQGGTSPYNVVWSSGETTEDLENIAPNIYSVVVTDFNGCEITGSWNVTRFEPLQLDVTTQAIANCEAQSVTQNFIALTTGGVPPYNYNWSSGTVSGINNEIMTTDENGLIILDVVDNLGCTSSFSFNVEIPVLGDPNFHTTSFSFENYGVFSIQDPIQFTNTATGDIVSILWDFGDGNFSNEEDPIHSYLIPQNYVVTQTVTYAFGCVYTKTLTLMVEKGYELIVPNAFTPNTDGLNDFFTPKYRGLDKLELKIYDTWGSLLYEETGDNLQGWNGEINNELAENGNYYYTFKGVTFYGKVILQQGAFVFIK